MKKKIYSIQDVKIHAYTPPFLAHNDGDAIRQLQTMFRKGEKNMMTEFPVDYKLFCLGSFNDVDGVILNEVTFVIDLDQLKDMENATQ